MGRELQKKKNRSGIAKATQNPKSKKRLLQHPVIAANWDKTQTLEQNYKRLGLTAKLNKHTGGVEKKAEDVIRAREEAVERGEARRKDDALAIASSRRPEQLDLQEARIERDPETGKILRVIDGAKVKKANPLNDPLAELDSESEDEGGDAFNQHASNTLKVHEDAGKRSEVVMKLQEEASRPGVKHKFRQSEGEQSFVKELVEKYGDDYAAMARDMKINYMQRSIGDLKKRVKRWKVGGGAASEVS
ncbi:hypothetical protein LTR08_004538 [Meristemomyces frigidus]|nr:hypothetical protein LTR08_004538 [Meristemomyces frigidus]